MCSSIEMIQQKNELFFELSNKVGNVTPISNSVRKSLLNPNIALSNTFEEIRVLGEGKSGKVVLVKDLDEHRFAVKECHSFSCLLKLFEGDSDSDCESDVDYKKLTGGLFDELGVAKNGLLEFEKSLLIDHPTIVKVYALFLKVHNSEVITRLLMEYLEGTELSRLEEGSLTRENAARGLNQILSALLHLIDRGFVPTDLHGSNIIVTKDACRMVDIEGHETLDEAERSDSSDSNLVDRLDEVWGLVQDFIRKSTFSIEEKMAFDNYKTCFYSKESVQHQLQVVTGSKNISILREFIQEIHNMTSPKV